MIVDNIQVKVKVSSEGVKELRNVAKAVSQLERKLERIADINRRLSQEAKKADKAVSQVDKGQMIDKQGGAGTYNLKQQNNEMAETVSLISQMDGTARKNSISVDQMQASLHSLSRTSTQVNKRAYVMNHLIDEASMVMWQYMIAAIPLKQVSEGFAILATSIAGSAIATASIGSLFESIRIQITGLTKSIIEADKAMVRAMDHAARTPFDVKQVAQASQVLQIIEHDQQQLLDAATAMAAGTMGAGHDIWRASEAMVDAVSGEFRRLRNTYHMTKEDIKAFAGDAIDAYGSVVDKSKFTTAMIEAIWARFGDAIYEYPSTIEGMYSNLYDEAIRLGKIIGEAIIPPLKETITWVRKMIEGIQGWIADNRFMFELIRSTFNTFTIPLVTALGLLSIFTGGLAAAAMATGLYMGVQKILNKTHFETASVLWQLMNVKGQLLKEEGKQIKAAIDRVGVEKIVRMEMEKRNQALGEMVARMELVGDTMDDVTTSSNREAQAHNNVTSAIKARGAANVELSSIEKSRQAQQMAGIGDLYRFNRGVGPRTFGEPPQLRVPDLSGSRVHPKDYWGSQAGFDYEQAKAPRVPKQLQIIGWGGKDTLRSVQKYNQEIGKTKMLTDRLSRSNSTLGKITDRLTKSTLTWGKAMGIATKVGGYAMLAIVFIQIAKAIGDAVVKARIFNNYMKEQRDYVDEVVESLSDYEGHMSEGGTAVENMIGRLDKIQDSTVETEQTIMSFGNRISESFDIIWRALNADTLQGWDHWWNEVTGFQKEIYNTREMMKSQNVVIAKQVGDLKKLVGIANDADEEWKNIKDEIKRSESHMERLESMERKFVYTGNEQVSVLEERLRLYQSSIDAAKETAKQESIQLEGQKKARGEILGFIKETEGQLESLKAIDEDRSSEGKALRKHLEDLREQYKLSESSVKNTEISLQKASDYVEETRKNMLDIEATLLEMNALAEKFRDTWASMQDRRGTPFEKATRGLENAKKDMKEHIHYMYEQTKMEHERGDVTEKTMQDTIKAWKILNHMSKTGSINEENLKWIIEFEKGTNDLSKLVNELDEAFFEFEQERIDRMGDIAGLYDKWAKFYHKRGQYDKASLYTTRSLKLLDQQIYALKNSTLSDERKSMEVQEKILEVEDKRYQMQKEREQKIKEELGNRLSYYQSIHKFAERDIFNVNRQLASYDRIIATLKEQVALEEDKWKKLDLQLRIQENLESREKVHANALYKWLRFRIDMLEAAGREEEAQIIREKYLLRVINEKIRLAVKMRDLEQATELSLERQKILYDDISDGQAELLNWGVDLSNELGQWFNKRRGIQKYMSSKNEYTVRFSMPDGTDESARAAIDEGINNMVHTLQRRL